MATETRILAVGEEGAASSAVREAADLLAAGGLVAFPTETVYGIGANADDPAAVGRLRELKRRPGTKPFSVHIADKDALKQHVDPVPFLGRKLVERFWPGPLTIVFGRGDGAMGVRLPAHDVAAAFLRACGVPVVAPSANRVGEEPASTAAEVARVFDGTIDAVLDGGPAPLAQASTVVRAWDKGWEVLREGVVSSEEIERALRTTLLFICTGNSCRSPIAEALCRHILAERLGVGKEDLPALGYEIGSAGTATAGGGRASGNASQAATDAGLDLAGHRSRPLTAHLIGQADRVYAMARSHADAARRMCPEAADKIVLLDPEGSDIVDPVGFPADQFTAVVNAIRGHLERRLDEL